MSKFKPGDVVRLKPEGTFITKSAGMPLWEDWIYKAYGNRDLTVDNSKFNDERWINIKILGAADESWVELVSPTVVLHF